MKLDDVAADTVGAEADSTDSGGSGQEPEPHGFLAPARQGFGTMRWQSQQPAGEGYGTWDHLPLVNRVLVGLGVALFVAAAYRYADHASSSPDYAGRQGWVSPNAPPAWNQAAPAPVSPAFNPPSSNPVPVPSDDRAVLMARFEGWKQAWEREDLDGFLSFYVPEAVIEPGNHERYGVTTLRDRRAKQFQTERNIQIVDLSVPQVDIQGNRATITVTKKYDSSVSHYQGTKTTVWVRSAGTWMITEEAFVEDTH